jgi:hypothetical protein
MFSVPKCLTDEVTLKSGDCALTYYPESKTITMTDTATGRVTTVGAGEYLSVARIMDRLFRIGEALAKTDEPVPIELARMLWAPDVETEPA